MYKAVIIDDIEQARKSLKKDILECCPEIELAGEAASVVEGVRLIQKLKPDVVFLDIQMPDGSGFDLLDILQDIHFHIIFTTASDAHAIRAFRFSALDYLLKPVDTDELKAAVKKLSALSPDNRQHLSLLKESLNGTRKQEKLALHSQDKIHVVNIADILRCESNVNYTEFHFNGGKKMLVTRTLKDFEELLSDQGFYRVHHSHLVNTRFIKEFIKTDGGYIIMNDGTNIPVSSRKRPEVIRMLENL
ncbi:MAG: LytR/AlgR family response regulator transcription factor [Bacteroidia bacterium]